MILISIWIESVKSTVCFHKYVLWSKYWVYESNVIFIALGQAHSIKYISKVYLFLRTFSKNYVLLFYFHRSRVPPSVHMSIWNIPCWIFHQVNSGESLVSFNVFLISKTIFRCFVLEKKYELLKYSYYILWHREMSGGRIY